MIPRVRRWGAWGGFRTGLETQARADPGFDRTKVGAGTFLTSDRIKFEKMEGFPRVVVIAAMKRFFTSGLSALLAVVFTGCGDSTTTNPFSAADPRERIEIKWKGSELSESYDLEGDVIFTRSQVQKMEDLDFIDENAVAFYIGNDVYVVFDRVRMKMLDFFTSYDPKLVGPANTEIDFPRAQNAFVFLGKRREEEVFKYFLVTGEMEWEAADVGLVDIEYGSDVTETNEGDDLILSHRRGPRVRIRNYHAAGGIERTSEKSESGNLKELFGKVLGTNANS